MWTASSASLDAAVAPTGDCVLTAWTMCWWALPVKGLGFIGDTSQRKGLKAGDGELSLIGGWLQ